MNFIKLLISIILVKACLLSSAQVIDTVNLSGTIKNDLFLEQKIYHITSNIIIYETATLSVSPGTTFILSPDVEIIVYGGLKFLGTKNDFILLKSLDSNDEGVGIVVKKYNYKKSIIFDYIKFTNLIKPIDFSKNWIRKEAIISNSVFKEITSYESAIQVKQPALLNENEQSIFAFSYNSFIDNKSNIYLENIGYSNVRYFITNNVFQNNFFYNDFNNYNDNVIAFSLNNISTSQEINDILKIQENIFINNYQFKENRFKIERPANIGATGNNKITILIDSNYFYNPNSTEDYTYDFSDNPHSPILQLNNKLDKNILTNLFLLKDLSRSTNSEIYYGGSMVNKKSTMYLTLMYFDTVTYKIKNKTIDTLNLETIDNHISLKFIFPFINEPHYYVVSGLKDIHGFEGANFFYGLPDFYYKIDSFNKALKYKVSSKNSFSDKDLINEQIKDNLPFRKVLSLGLFAGYSNYFGDLKDNSQFEFSESRLAYGLRVSYSFSPYFDTKLSLNSLVIEGSDATSNSGFRNSRGLSFSSQIYDFSLIGNMFLMSRAKKHYVYPYFGGGISVFNFNPIKTIDGIDYKLNSIGSEGQTINGGENYSLTQIGIPLNFGVEAELLSKIVLGFEINIIKTFTDYLDDVSTKYADPTDVANANPTIPIETIREITGSSSNNIGMSRGNPERLDWYMYSGFLIRYKL